MPKYEIFAGLNGGFNSIVSKGIYDCVDMEQAEDLAYEFAIEEYQAYEGAPGLPCYEEILNECSSEEEAENEYWEEVNMWIECYAVLVG